MTQCQSFNFGSSPIPCHTWNKDRSLIAFSPNNNDIEIHQNKGSNWTQQATLKKHDLRVMGLDWAPNTNKIVSCSADRNAYVWTQDSINTSWTPTLVLLRMNRAATCVKWSPNENKFAIGSGSRLVAVAYYERENDWWVTRHIKKSFRSTVTTLDWHPNNMLLATGGTDFRVRVFSAFIKDVEEAAKETVWGIKGAFGQLMAEYVNAVLGGGWIHCVRFSPDGGKVAWVSHDSSINIADPTLNTPLTKLHTKFLPFLTCIWIDNQSIVAAGHDCQPFLYTLADNKLALAGKVDNNSQKKESQGISALSKFRMMEQQARAEKEDVVLESVHQNPITCFCVYQGDNSKGKVVKISSSGLDGQVVVWTVDSLEKSMRGLRI